MNNVQRKIFKSNKFFKSNMKFCEYEYIWSDYNPGNKTDHHYRRSLNCISTMQEHTKKHTSITSILKSKNQTEKVVQEQTLQQQKQPKDPPNKEKPKKPRLPSALLSRFRWHYYHWITLERTLCLPLHCKFTFVLLSFISLVKAYTTTIKPLVETFETDFVVCLPANDSKFCTKYVNSSKNGLIELNEVLYPALKGFRGAYDYKMIARINPFWLTFEPPSDTSYYVMGTLYMIIFVFGVTGNGLVIYMFARCKALRTASYILVFNLAISDLLIVIKCPMAAYNNFMRGPALGDWGCRLYGFVGGFSGTASIGMLTVIALDRYSVVVNPLSPMRLNYKTKYYYFLMLLSWSDALFFSMIPLLEIGLSVYVPEGYLTTCSFDYLDKSMKARIFMFIFFVFAWCIPLFIICYCYFHILKAVFNSKNIQSNRKKHKVEVRLAFIVLLVIGLWFLAWTPYAIVAMTGVFGLERYLTPTRSMIPALFCKTASCLNPFLYTISHKRFRNELQRLFCKRRPVYQYSLTRSSFVSRSSRRGRHRVDLYNNGHEYRPELDTYHKSLKSKLCIDNITISGVVNSTLYDTGIEGCSSVYRHHQMPQKLNKKSSHFKKHTSPVVSSEDAGIYVLEVDDLVLDNLSRPPSIETKF